MVARHSSPSSESSASSASCWRVASRERTSSRNFFLSCVAPVAEVMALATWTERPITAMALAAAPNGSMTMIAALAGS